MKQAPVSRDLRCRYSADHCSDIIGASYIAYKTGNRTNQLRNGLQRNYYPGSKASRPEAINKFTGYDKDY